MSPVDIYRNQMHLLHNFVDGQTHLNDAKQKISAADQKANDELFAKRVKDGIQACEAFQNKEPIAGEASVIREILSRIHKISLSDNAFSNPTLLASMREELPLLKTEIERVAQVVCKTLLAPAEKEMKREEEAKLSQDDLVYIWTNTTNSFNNLAHGISRAELYEMINNLLTLPLTIPCFANDVETRQRNACRCALELIQDPHYPSFFLESQVKLRLCTI